MMWQDPHPGAAWRWDGRTPSCRRLHAESLPSLSACRLQLEGWRFTSITLFAKLCAPLLINNKSHEGGAVLPQNFGSKLLQTILMLCFSSANIWLKRIYFYNWEICRCGCWFILMFTHSSSSLQPPWEQLLPDSAGPPSQSQTPLKTQNTTSNNRL